MAKRTKIARVDEEFYKKYERLAKEFEKKYGVRLRFSDYTKMLSDVNFNVNVLIVDKKKRKRGVFDIL